MFSFFWVYRSDIIMVQRKPSFQVIIRKLDKPIYNDLEAEFDWICKSLGFFENIDRDKSASLVFKELVSATELGESLSSTDVAERLDLSRGAAINHLNNLMRSGLIEKHGTRYFARSKSVLRTIEELEEDIERIFNTMKKTASLIDFQLKTRPRRLA